MKENNKSYAYFEYFEVYMVSQRTLNCLGVDLNARHSNTKESVLF